MKRAWLEKCAAELRRQAVAAEKAQDSRSPASAPRMFEAADIKMPRLSSLRMSRLRCSSPGGPPPVTRRASDEDQHLARFLREIGLGMYVDVLMRSGFDDMETLCDIDDADMKDLGIPRGHALKLRRHLHKYQSVTWLGEDGSPPQSLQASGRRQEQHSWARALPERLGRTTIAAPRVLPAGPAKTAVEWSWERLQAVGAYTVGEILYLNLFRVMPESTQLFPTHVREKYREWLTDEAEDDGSVFMSQALRNLFGKVVNAVGCAVAGQRERSLLVPMLTQLGQRHSGYGVHEAHFEALGTALTLTLYEILGTDFTPELEDAWTSTFSYMTCHMLHGLRAARATAEYRSRKAASMASMRTGYSSLASSVPTRSTEVY